MSDLITNATGQAINTSIQSLTTALNTQNTAMQTHAQNLTTIKNTPTNTSQLDNN